MKKKYLVYQKPSLIRMDVPTGHLCITASERDIDGSDMELDEVDDDFWESTE